MRLSRVTDRRDAPARRYERGDQGLRRRSSQVLHPFGNCGSGLENHPGHHRARELFDGFGGMVSFELKGGVDAARRFIRSATLPINAPSLGGVETLITRPSTTSHSGMSPEDRRRAGISDGLIRLSVGIEAAEDLIEDFNQALELQARS